MKYIIRRIHFVLINIRKLSPTKSPKKKIFRDMSTSTFLKNAKSETLFFSAVDMWSAGVILLCILSRRYPFFKAKDDLQALAQMMALFGSKQMERMASEIGKCSTVFEQGKDFVKIL